MISCLFIYYSRFKECSTEQTFLFKCACILVEKYPKFKERSDQIIGGDEKSNEIHKAVKAEPVDSYNDERLDASALTFTVMVGSKELLVRCYNTSLFTAVSQYFTSEWLVL